jgi:hypothetical protein
MISRIAKLAAIGAVTAADQHYGVESAEPPPAEDPVAALTDAIRHLDEPVKPWWLYEEKKKDDGRDLSWGPPTPLHAGDAAERNTAFGTGLGIGYGGV